VVDEFSDELLATYGLRYGSKQVKPDQLLPDGTVNYNQRIPPNVVVPSEFRKWIEAQFVSYEDAGKVQDAAGSIASLQCGIDPSNSGRIEVGSDIHVIDQLHQSTHRLAEVSTG
jgi:phage tail sheath gpL-like